MTRIEKIGTVILSAMYLVALPILLNEWGLGLAGLFIIGCAVLQESRELW